MAFYLSVFVCVVARLIPHPANFTPLGSLILLNSKKSSLWQGIALALIVMIISDIFLGFSFASIFVYLGFISYALWGRIKKLHAVFAAVFASISFFLISNFGVWLGPWYPHNLSGLLNCFINAIPFYRNTIISDALFVIVFLLLGKVYFTLKKKYQFKEELTWVKSLRVAISRKK